jgi:hypothetical protein
MGWLSNKFLIWATNSQAKDLEQFTARLSAMDSYEIGMIVAVATDRRHKLGELYGWDMLDPLSVEKLDPYAAVKLSRIIKQVQSDGHTIVAAGLMVWIHTLRAGTSLDLRILGRRLWSQLSRGFPHAIDAELSLDNTRRDGIILNMQGYDQFPIGLTPLPL